MRVDIETDLDEFGPELGIIDMWWVDPPASVRHRFVPTYGKVMGLLMSQIFVTMDGFPIAGKIHLASLAERVFLPEVG